MCINRIRLEFKDHSCDAIRYFVKVLIESDWNLKSLSFQMLSFGFGINRIRLEFKDRIASRTSLEPSGINRIRLEFKENKNQSESIVLNSINRIRLEFKGHLHSPPASRRFSY